jgi:hypothetical protein
MLSKICLNLAKSAYIGAVLPICASAWATSPLVQCQATTFEGASVCAVDMDSYAQLAGSGVSRCPSGVTSTGSALLCEQTFDAAIHDAKLYFGATSPPSQAYVIRIASGTYDFSSQTRVLPGKSGAIDVSGVAPISPGCLTGSPAATGIVTLSGSPCLVISGAGPTQTTLVTAASLNGIAGTNVSHVMVENMTMVQPNHSTTQGIYVSQASRSIRGVEYPTLTLDIAPGFPTPLELFQMNCAANGPAGCTAAGLATVANDVYMRAYTNTDSPQLIQSTSLEDSNKQYPFGYPSVLDTIRDAAPPRQPDPANFPNRWTLTLSSPLSHRNIPSYYSAMTAGVMNLVCMKVDHANALWFDDTSSDGTDIIANNMVWMGAARSTFRGVRGARSGEALGAQVYNSSIERSPPVGGQVTCLSTQSGGMQFGQPGDRPIYGNAVYGLKAHGTGDDSIAMFNDIGGTPDGQGGYYPQTYIRQSIIGNSFARDILLENTREMTRLAGNSPVIVDAFTQGEINNDGHCDPLVLGDANCPVTYANY